MTGSGSRGLSRREVLRGAALGLVVVASGSACRSPEKSASCHDTSKLSPEDVKSRSTVGYVESTPQPGKDCASCSQYLAAPASGQCGGCKVLKGPIDPRGWCKVFAPLT